MRAIVAAVLFCCAQNGLVVSLRNSATSPHKPNRVIQLVDGELDLEEVERRQREFFHVVRHQFEEDIAMAYCREYFGRCRACFGERRIRLADWVAEVDHGTITMHPAVSNTVEVFRPNHLEIEPMGEFWWWKWPIRGVRLKSLCKKLATERIPARISSLRFPQSRSQENWDMAVKGSFMFELTKTSGPLVEQVVLGISQRDFQAGLGSVVVLCQEAGGGG